MAIPSVETLCVQITTAPGEICIEFPGGAKICAQVGYEFGDPTEITKSIFGQLNSALAPMAPIFNIMDVVAAVFECIKAIPDSLGPPPDPTAVIACIDKLTKVVEKLLKMIPALSIPSMVKSLINTIIVFLLGLKARLAAMIKKQLMIIAAATRASELGNVQLQLAVDCAQGNLDAQLVNLNAGMTPLNRFLGIVSIFMQIAGLGCLPSFANIGELTGDVLSPIDAIVEVLIAIRDAIPDIPAIELGDGQTGDC